jgi:hypothetical protein
VRRRLDLLALLLVVAALAAAVSACGEDGPRRVLLVGDSVMSQTGPALARALPDDDVRNEAVSGSGLLTPDYVDWPTELRRLLERFDPDVVVFLFVGNFDLGTGETFTTADGGTISTREDPAFDRAWRVQAHRMTERAEDAGAEVVWVLPPPMQGRDDQAVVEGLRSAYEEVVDEVGGTLVDANEVLADDEGRFIGTDEEGTPVRVPDGVHLAPHGARLLGGLIAEELGG